MNNSIRNMLANLALFVAAGAAHAQPLTPPGPGFAVSFSGGVITIPDAPSLTLGTSATIECWLRPLSDANEQRFIEKGDGGGCESDRSFDIGLNPNWMSGTGNITPWWFFKPGCTEVHYPATWTAGEWSHFATTIDTVAGVQRLYVNGQLAVESSVPSAYLNRPIGDSASPLVLGGSGGFSLRYFGEMDEVRVWSTARTQQQIAGSMNQGVFVAAPGLVAYYSFDEGDGGVVHDQSGQSNNGTLGEGVAWVAITGTGCVDPLASGHGVLLDGTSGYISVPDSPSLDFDQLMTMEMWINIDHLNPGQTNVAPRPLSKGDGSNWNSDRSYEFSISHLGMPTAAFFGGTLGSYIELDPVGTTIQPDRWYHLAATLDGAAGVARLFIDGQLAVERTVSEGGGGFAGMHLTNSSRALEVGTTSAVYWTPTPFFPGKIDEVRLWNVARSPAQIAASYHCQVDANTPGLAAYYRFDEGAGSIAHDLSGHGNNGAFVGGATWQSQVPVCKSDFGSQGGIPGPDGVLDNNDFVIFIAYFFAQLPSADVGMQGGLLGFDGHFDNNDFIVFIDQFFAGC